MIVVVCGGIGLLVGVFAVLGWLSVDLLFDLSSLTEHRALGVVLACVVLSQIAWVAIIGYEELRS